MVWLGAFGPGSRGTAERAAVGQLSITLTAVTSYQYVVGLTTVLSTYVVVAEVPIATKGPVAASAR